MGWVDIPEQPPRGGGRLSATLVLEGLELKQTVDLLKEALSELIKDAPSGIARIDQQIARQQPGLVPTSVPVAVPARAVPPASLPQTVPVPQPRPVLPTPTAVPVAVPAPAPAPQSVPFKQQQVQQQVQQQRPPFAQPQPVVQQPQPQPRVQQVQQSLANLQLQQPRPQQPQPQPQRVPAPAPIPQQQQAQQQYGAAAAAAQQDAWSSVMAQPAPTASVPSSVAPAAAAAASSRWQLSYTTEPEDHNNAAVSALAYAQSLPGLPGGDGHAGWLVSGSKGMMNLWETNRAAAGDEMALLCMHSQAVDLVASKIVLEPDTKLLFGASLSAKDGAECISVHSLDAEVGLLSMRYKFAPPPDRARAQQRLMQQVVSVHGMTPGLRSSIIASFGERLLMFEAKPGIRANSVLHDAAFHFVAHPGSVVTCLHRSPIEGSCALISGAQDGKIHLWDLKSPPKSNMPAMRMTRHTKNVTGLTLISDDRLASSSMDGSVLLWDLRATGSPLHSTSTPGGAGVLKMAPGPWGDILAVSTAKGLHCLELFDFEAPMANIAPYPLPRPFTDIVFNMVTHDLYAGSGNGSVQVFSRLA